MVNILLQKFDTSSKKEMKMIKQKFYDEKSKKGNAKKWNGNHSVILFYELVPLTRDAICSKL